ncbi:MAG: hypothetical protein PHE36_06040 [Novosphingobium sp.]|nr:hypothetical protein [Novosphingobium sp.]
MTSTSPRPNEPGPIVHIGYHKTATTWLQKAVLPSSSTHTFIPRKTVQQALLVPPGLHFDPGKAREILAAGQCGRPVVFSEENLSGYLHNGGLHGLIGPEMARRIKGTLPDARIVIFIRNQLDILRASYAQYVSGGGTFGQTRYFGGLRHLHGALTRPWKAPAFEMEHFEFDRLIAYYDSLFGKDRVFVYPFEWLRDTGALLERMERDLGIRFAEDVAGMKEANVSLGGGGLLLLRFVNLFTRQSVANKSWLIDLPGGQGVRHAGKWLIGRLPGVNRRKHRLPDKVRARALEHYAMSNRRLLELRDLPLAELGYPLGQ